MGLSNRLIAKIARTGGGKLLDKTAGKLFPSVIGGDATKPKSTIAGAIAGAAITRIATRSVPGAIAVGGGLLAKALYDRRRQARARRREAEAQEDVDA